METMLNVKQAVQKAVQLASELFSDAKEIRLEEVELVPEYWDVTVSFTRTTDPGYMVFAGKGNRDYKTIRIAASNGELNSVKIRTL